MRGTNRPASEAGIFQLKVQLRAVRPSVWRRVLVRGEVSLADVHKVIQAVMGWTDSHLHEFEINGARYAQPDPDADTDEVADESIATLSQVAELGTRVGYTCDFGDDWLHDVVVEKVFDPDPVARYPSCIGGERACPPEDVGGPWGYEEFVAAVSNPDHDAHARCIEWARGRFDPEAFDLAGADRALQALGSA